MELETIPETVFRGPKRRNIIDAEEHTGVKKVTRELFNKMKLLLVLNWRQKSTGRSRLKLAIEDVLDTGMPGTCTPELFRLVRA